MLKMLKFSPLMLAGLLLAGCSSTITNLTPSKHLRNASGHYPVEVAWDTSDQTVRPSSLTPVIVVGFETYPMKPTLNMMNRWEGVIPVPADKTVVPYHIRFNYKYNSFGKPQESTRLSPGYRLEILDNK